MVTARELRDMVYSCLIEDLRRINIAPPDEKHENSSFRVELENDSIEEDSIEEAQKSTSNSSNPWPSA
jgi:hypothetical protein